MSRSLRLVSSFLLLVVASVLGGCDEPIPRHLNEIAHPRLRVEVESDMVKVYLDQDECALLGPELEARIARSTVIQSHGENCSQIWASGYVDLAHSGDSLFVELSDGTETFSATYDQVFVSDPLELVAPEDGQLFGGDAVVMRWTQPGAELSRPELWFTTIDDLPVSWKADGVAQDGERFEATVPVRAEVASSVHGILRLYVAVQPPLRLCSGAEACTIGDILTAGGVVLDYTGTPRP